MRPLAMMDLFSGTGSASRAAAVRGWRVLRVDNALDACADVRADVALWSPPAGPWDLVWASPPCAAFSTANQRTRDPEAGLELVRAALRVIQEARPRWWVLENVHGATRAIGGILGPPVQVHGSVYLWGVFPPFEATVARDKTRKSGRQRARRRAAIPWAISDGLVRACEALSRELPLDQAPPASLRTSSQVPPRPEFAPLELPPASLRTSNQVPPRPDRTSSCPRAGAHRVAAVSGVSPSSPRGVAGPAPDSPPAIAGSAPDVAPFGGL